MTREEAIKWMQEEKASFERAPDLNGCPMTECWQKAIDVYEMAISALRQQGNSIEIEAIKPLTLDELRAMNGEPVYIVSGDVSWWDIVGNSSNYLILRSGEALPYKKYGEWLACRHKPDEVQK